MLSYSLPRSSIFSYHCQHLNPISFIFYCCSVGCIVQSSCSPHIYRFFSVHNRPPFLALPPFSCPPCWACIFKMQLSRAEVGVVLGRARFCLSIVQRRIFDMLDVI
uniref:Uncharacterized protein n=1 Tax=Parascaris equorum TaxID=6256 RepID=A0A914S3C9_PAREQ